MPEAAPSILSSLREAILRLFADEAIPLAGNIAFRTLFSVFPFLIFLTTIAGFIGNDKLAESVVTFLLSAAPKHLVEPLVPEVRSILTTPRRGLAGLAALLTLWSAMSGVDSIRVGLNRAYDLREHRTLWQLYGLDIVVVIGAVAVLLAFSLLIVVAPVTFNIIETYAPGFRQSVGTLDIARYPIAIVLLAGALLLCHHVLPARRMAFAEVAPGVALTVLVWVILAAAFSAYLVKFNTFALTYASLSGIFAAMFFVYLSALVLILGGELNRVITVHREARNHVMTDDQP